MRQLMKYHPTIGYQFIPGLRTRVPHESGGYLVRTNGTGFRSEREFEQELNPGHRRVLLFGDSFTAGDGVSNRYRYGDQLEQRVSNLEVYNFGLPGTGTDQQDLAWQQFGKTLESHLLVLGVLVENVRRVAARYRPFFDETGREVFYEKPRFVLAGDSLEVEGPPLRKNFIEEDELARLDAKAVDRGGRMYWARMLVRRLHLQDLAQRLTRYNPTPEYNRPDNASWRVMRRILEEWIVAYGGPVLLVPIPLYQFVEETSDPTHYQARFAEVAEATGCHLHDPLPDLRKRPIEQRRKFRFEADVHMTPAGHAALADSLAPVVDHILTQSHG